MQGSWGKDVIDCCWDEDGNVCAELPPLQPGLHHYNFLINGSQVIIANKFPFSHQLCSVLWFESSASVLLLWKLQSDEGETTASVIPHFKFANKKNQKKSSLGVQRGKYWLRLQAALPRWHLFTKIHCSVLFWSEGKLQSVAVTIFYGYKQVQGCS